MAGGWIKLHRQLLNSDTFKNEKLLKVWIYCLLKASHADHEQLVGRQKVKLLPGQFIYGRKKAAEALGMPESTIRCYVEILEKIGNITIKPTNKYSVITVINWGLYQSDEEIYDSKQANKRTTNEPTDGHKQECKRMSKNGKEEKDSSSSFSESDPAYQAALYLASKIITNNPKAAVGEKKLQAWAKDFDRLNRIGVPGAEPPKGYVWDEIYKIIDWCQVDAFWRGNILSAGKLREKVITLENQMARKDEKEKDKQGIRPNMAKALRLVKMTQDEGEPF